jgi:hypothetical protein
MVLIFSSCKPVEKSSLVLYSVQSPVTIEVSSSCRTSSVSLAQDEAILKEKINESSRQSLAKLKIKESSSPGKSNYRISKTELVITERCGTIAGSRPFIGLRQVLVLENILSKQLVEFSSDTVVVEQQSLGKPDALAGQKVKLEPYVLPLTEKNFIKAKAYFKKR